MIFASQFHVLNARRALVAALALEWAEAALPTEGQAEAALVETAVATIVPEESDGSTDSSTGSATETGTTTTTGTDKTCLSVDRRQSLTKLPPIVEVCK